MKARFAFGVIVSLIIAAPVLASINLNSSRSNIYRLTYPSDLATSAQAKAILAELDKMGPADEAKLKQWLPAAANFFGPPGSGFGYDCLRFGLKARDNGQLTELYLSMLERRLANVGLAMPRLTPGYPHALA